MFKRIELTIDVMIANNDLNVIRAWKYAGFLIEIGAG